MPRKALAALSIWMLLVAACGGGEDAPTSTAQTGATNPPETSAAGEAGPSSTAPGPASEGESQPDRGAEAAAEPGNGTAAATQEAGTSDTVGPDVETPAADNRDTENPGAESVGGGEYPSTTAAASTATAYSGPVSPVNGFPVDDSALIDRKLVAVKIDNHWDSRPQSGLERADAVFELVVESGITRFIALFHHSDADWVGPMRSARPTDWTLVKPLNGVMTVSGGQPWITSQFPRNDVPLIGDLGPPLTNRWRERKAPHNLYVNTYEARRVAEERGLDPDPPPQLFPRGRFSGSETVAVSHIFFDWSDTMDAAWTWDGARYVRSVEGEPHLWQSREGDVIGQISADVLIVLMAERYRACPSGEGSCVPAWTTVGENRALVFAQGRYAEGRWRRDDANDWFTVTDQAGEEIVMPPGRMWIMIYPETADIIW